MESEVTEDRTSRQKEHRGIYLECFSSTASCDVSLKMKIHNRTAEKAFILTSNSRFGEKKAWGKEIEWKRLVDPVEGFIKDNSITVEVTFCTV